MSSIINKFKKSDDGSGFNLPDLYKKAVDVGKNENKTLGFFGSLVLTIFALWFQFKFDTVILKMVITAFVFVFAISALKYIALLTLELIFGEKFEELMDQKNKTEGNKELKQLEKGWQMTKLSNRFEIYSSLILSQIKNLMFYLASIDHIDEAKTIKLYLDSITESQKKITSTIEMVSDDLETFISRLNKDNENVIAEIENVPYTNIDFKKQIEYLRKYNEQKDGEETLKRVTKNIKSIKNINKNTDDLQEQEDSYNKLYDDIKKEDIELYKDRKKKEEEKEKEKENK